MGEKEVSKNDNLKSALCYAPFVGIVLFFIESNKTTEFKKHIKYGTFLLVGYLILNLLFWGIVAGLLFVLYIGAISFIMWKVYNGEDIDLEYIDKFEETVKEKIRDADNKTDEDK